MCERKASRKSGQSRVGGSLHEPDKPATHNFVRATCAPRPGYFHQALRSAHRTRVSISNASTRVPADDRRAFATAMRWGLSATRGRARPRGGTVASSGPVATPQIGAQGECVDNRWSAGFAGRAHASVADGRLLRESDRRCTRPPALACARVPARTCVPLIGCMPVVCVCPRAPAPRCDRRWPAGLDDRWRPAGSERSRSAAQRAGGRTANQYTR